MKDEVPKGRIILSKTGEVVKYVIPMAGDWNRYAFLYRMGRVSGATFELSAAEDLVSGTSIVKKGTLVARVTTDEHGSVLIDGIPLGKYTLVETKAATGYQLDSTPRTIELKYADQYTGVIQAGVEAENKRIPFHIKLVKTASDTELPLEGAVFGLYTRQAIKDAMGMEVVSKGALIELVMTDHNGVARVYTDLPAGKYYFKELKAPAGYAVSEKEYDVPLTSKKGGESVFNKKITMEVEDKPIVVEISKTDITGEQELRGAVMALYDSDGKLVEKWLTNGVAKKFKKLPHGQYVLREEYAPFGYTIANEIRFTVDDRQEIQKVVMKDELIKGRIVIEKVDADTKKPLEGTEFEIRDKDGNVIETLVTDKDGKAVSGKLDIGIFKNGECEGKITYYVVETKAAKGYVLDETAHEVTFSYDSEKEPPEVIRYHLSVKNRKHPRTGGEYQPVWFYLGGGILILIGGLIIIFARKKEKE